MVIEHAAVLEKVNKVIGQNCKNLSLLGTIEVLTAKIVHLQEDNERLENLVEALTNYNQRLADSQLVKASYMDLDD